MKKLLFFFFLFVSAQNLFATHFEAGEITYEYVGTSTTPYKYRITITTYTKWTSTGSTDNCELVVHFGDGDTAIAPRINGAYTSPCAPSSAEGEMIPGTTTRKNIYVAYHNYDGPGNYIITMEEMNQIDDVCNIPDSENQPFFLRSELVINPFLGNNNSPFLINPPIDNACVGVCFEHNPGAYDIDGDSLYYSLSTCYGEDGLPIPF